MKKKQIAKAFIGSLRGAGESFQLFPSENTNLAARICDVRARILACVNQALEEEERPNLEGFQLDAAMLARDWNRIIK